MSARNLGGAEVIGGAVVTVTANLAGLRAAESEAKLITERIGKLTASIGTGGIASASGGTASAGGAAGATAAASSVVASAEKIGRAYNTINSNLSNVSNNVSNVSSTVNNVSNNMQRAATNINNVANTFNQSVNNVVNNIERATGGSGGGGVGSGGNGGLGAGLGRRNLFSVRGLASALGVGMTGVFAALEVAKGFGAYAEATQTESQYDRLVRPLGVRAQNDAFIIDRAEQIAQRKAKLERVQFWESIPILGMSVSIPDKLTGYSKGIENAIAVREEKNRSRLRSLENSDEISMRSAEATGDPRIIAAERERQQMQSLREAYGNQGDFDSSIAAWRQRQFYATTTAPRAEAQAAGRAKSIALGGVGAGFDIQAGGASSQARMMEAQNANQRDVIEKQREALNLKASAELARNSAEYAKSAGMSAYERAPATAAFEQGQAKILAQQEDQEKDFGAKLIEINRSTDNQILEAKAAGQAAMLNSSREYYEAERTMRDASHTIALSNMKEGPAKAAYAAAFAQEDAAFAVENERKRGIEREHYQTQEAMANLRTANQPITASVVGLAANLKRELENASPSEFGYAQAAAVAEMKEKIHDLTVPGGGGTARIARPGERVNDYLDLSGEARDKRNAIAAANNNLAAMSAKNKKAAVGWRGFDNEVNAPLNSNGEAQKQTTIQEQMRDFLQKISQAVPFNAIAG